MTEERLDAILGDMVRSVESRKFGEKRWIPKKKQKRRGNKKKRGGSILQVYARLLIKRATGSEKRLRERICRSDAEPIFLFQRPLFKIIPDFQCPGCKLIVEVDGGYHNTEKQREKDKRRDAFLRMEGWEVLRFTNREVGHDIDRVVTEIKRIARFR